MVAPYDVFLSEHDVVQPDVLVSCDRSKFTAAGHEGAPDLMVEVLSPSSLRHDRMRKFNLYARSEVPEFWIINPHPLMVEVMSLRDGIYGTIGVYSEGDWLVSARFPELKVAVSDLLAGSPITPPPLDEVRECTPDYSTPLS